HGDAAAPAAAGPLDLVDLVDDGDVGMVQRGGHPRLPQEAKARAFVPSSAQHLERDLAVEAQVLGQVDLAHASASEALQDAVVGRRLADYGRLRTNYRPF